jgi:hypothetical protein
LALDRGVADAEFEGDLAQRRAGEDAEEEALEHMRRAEPIRVSSDIRI